MMIAIGENALRETCPEEENLADYLEGRLSQEAKDHIEEHLAACELCFHEFTVAREILKAQDQLRVYSVPDAVTEKAIRTLDKELALTKGSGRVRLGHFLRHLHEELLSFLRSCFPGRWSFVPIRGSKKVVSKDFIHIRKIFKEIEMDIEIEKTSEDRGDIRVRLVRGPGRPGVRVTLKKADREMASYPLAEGYVLFEDVPFGHYALVFSRDGKTLGAYFFEIKGHDHGRG
ncbi:MAG: zf-HC2 domain-containing protein [Deltaproteobacteria bacterium]|nr:zf-HC2 domain-containing protein [Deltaproteobacteria bacterium]MBW2138060.1 zf-HC2 domain-containing protein [Deltaproteobacteria bacterium]